MLCRYFLGLLYLSQWWECNRVPIPGVVIYSRDLQATSFDFSSMQPDLEPYVPHDHQGEGYLPWSWRRMRTDFNAIDLQQISPVKPQDNVPKVGFGSANCQLPLSGKRGVAKRSIQRACRRAQHDGYAWYRGQHLSLDDFPDQIRHRCSKAHSQRTKNPEATHSRISPQNRLNVLHVNVGGLAADRFTEIQCWALNKEADVIVLTETRWSFCADWQLPLWNVIHSGSEHDRSDGILILINKNVAPDTAIGLTEIIIGRLLHLRIHYMARAFDLICCYQFVDNHSLTNKNKRSLFWNSLEKHLCQIPNRNT